MDLLDASRLDPPVLDELLERHARGLPADRVEAGEHHGLGGVVDDDVDARRGLERADVPALPADDPALHVLARQREDADAGLCGLLGRDPLDRDRDDLAGPLLALLAGALLDLADLRHRAPLGLVDHLGSELLPGLGGRHPRDPLELRLVLVGGLLQLFPHERELVLPLLQLRGSPVDPLAALAEVGLGLGDAAFEAPDLLAAVLEVLLGLAPHPRGFLLGFLEPLGPRLGGLLFGIQEELLPLCFGGARVGRSDRVPDDESRDAPDHEAEEAGDDGVHRSSRCLGRGISVPDQGATEEASGS